jgi:hypothetical protein
MSRCRKSTTANSTKNTGNDEPTPPLLDLSCLRGITGQTVNNH